MRACKSDGALRGDPLLEVLMSGGLHLVVTEVVPIGGGAGKEKSSYVVQCLSGELRMVWIFLHNLCVSVCI